MTSTPEMKNNSPETLHVDNKIRIDSKYNRSNLALAFNIRSESSSMDSKNYSSSSLTYYST